MVAEIRQRHRFRPRDFREAIAGAADHADGRAVRLHDEYALPTLGRYLMTSPSQVRDVSVRIDGVTYYYVQRYMVYVQSSLEKK